MCICLSKMIRIFLFLHEFAARGFFLHRYDVIDSSSVPHEKPRIYDVDRETYIFSLSYIYFVRYNKYISTTCKYGMEGLNKLALSYTVHVHVVLWAIADLTILIHVPGFKFVSEILICRSSQGQNKTPKIKIMATYLKKNTCIISTELLQMFLFRSRPFSS